MKPIRCMLGRHTGQTQGGTMMFTCPRCRGSFWQPRDYSHVTRATDAALERGDVAGAHRLVREALVGSCAECGQPAGQTHRGTCSQSAMSTGVLPPPLVGG